MTVPVPSGISHIAIESIAAGGNGVGRIEGRVVFVPRSAPGDEGTVRVRSRGRYATGIWEHVEVPSPARADPPCQHYTRDRCGGCQLQHLDYSAQRAAKSRIIVDALQRIGGRTVTPPIVEASPLEWRYRIKLTLAMRRRGGRWIAGLHRFDNPASIFKLADCLITDERVVRGWQAVLAAAQYLPDALELRGAVRLNTAGRDGVLFTLEGGKSWPGAPSFFAAVPALAALWWSPADHRLRLLAERDGTTVDGASFAQVNASVATMLRAHVVASVRSYSPRHVVDGYAGSGDTAVALAASGARVTAIEVDHAAASVARGRLPAGSRCLDGKVEDRLASVLPADVIVLNPPRGGVASAVCAVIENARPTPRAVVYVSCDPATLARDCQMLPSYSISSVHAFDMFPQTAHVETVCVLVPAAA